jgi:hypothetical protein
MVKTYDCALEDGDPAGPGVLDDRGSGVECVAVNHW